MTKISLGLKGASTWEVIFFDFVNHRKETKIEDELILSQIFEQFSDSLEKMRNTYYVDAPLLAKLRILLHL